MKATNTESIAWINKIHQSGYRLTKPRLAIINTLSQSSYILDAHKIFLQARNLYPSLSLVTVYRTLERLESLGLIWRVHEHNGCHSFIAAHEGHMHVIICQNCNRVDYFSGDELWPIIKPLGTHLGYKIHEHWVQLFGICKSCLSQSKQAYIP